MNKKKTVQDIIDEVTKPDPKKDPGTAPQPAPKPAELDQDPGGGYNPDHTVPQT